MKLVKINYFGSKKNSFFISDTGGPKRVERMRFLARKVLRCGGERLEKTGMFLFTHVPLWKRPSCLVFLKGWWSCQTKEVIMKPVILPIRYFAGSPWYHPYGDNKPVEWISSAFSSITVKLLCNSAVKRLISFFMGYGWGLLGLLLRSGKDLFVMVF